MNLVRIAVAVALLLALYVFATTPLDQEESTPSVTLQPR